MNVGQLFQSRFLGNTVSLKPKYFCKARRCIIKMKRDKRNKNKKNSISYLNYFQQDTNKKHSNNVSDVYVKIYPVR